MTFQKKKSNFTKIFIVKDPYTISGFIKLYVALRIETIIWPTVLAFYHFFYLIRGNTERSLIHAIETVIIEWSHQVRDVLKKDSAQPLLEGLNPGPLVEIEFWKAKSQNLECIYDQVHKIHSKILPVKFSIHV